MDVPPPWQEWHGESVPAAFWAMEPGPVNVERLLTALAQPPATAPETLPPGPVTRSPMLPSVVAAADFVDLEMEEREAAPANSTDSRTPAFKRPASTRPQSSGSTTSAATSPSPKKIKPKSKPRPKRKRESAPAPSTDTPGKQPTTRPQPLCCFRPLIPVNFDQFEG